MPFDFLMFIAMFATIFGGLFSVICIYDDIRVLKWIFPILLSIGLVSIFWLTIAGTIPWEVEKTYLVKVYKIEHKDIVFVERECINLNHKFSRSFNEGDLISVKIYKDKLYGGIWWHLPDPKLEVVENISIQQPKPVEFENAA